MKKILLLIMCLVRESVYCDVSADNSEQTEEIMSLEMAPQTNYEPSVNFTRVPEFDFNIEQKFKMFQTVLKSYNEECLLDNMKSKLMWWTTSNGSLATDHIHITKSRRMLDLSYRCDNDWELKNLGQTETSDRDIIEYLSLAGNNLTQVPFETLKFFQANIKYLTLRHNTLGESKILALFKSHRLETNWGPFPQLPLLKQLDLSHCQIDNIPAGIFHNLTGLEQLFMSHNHIANFGNDAFMRLNKVKYLDLSFTVPFNIDNFHNPAIQSYLHMLFNMVQVSQHTFKNLTSLEYLDMSHTCLSQNSAISFTNFRSKLRFLSLCYTGFPLIGSQMFRNTRLKAIDLSGNPTAGHHIGPLTFKSVARSLKYVFFDNSDLKQMDWVMPLRKLTALFLRSNNINAIPEGIFNRTRNLEVVDLSSNHITNWYSSVFASASKLKLLNVCDNNINIITSEMLRDFQGLKFLGISNNNFVCDCVLQDLLEIAAANNHESQCAEKEFTDLEFFGALMAKLNHINATETILDLLKENDRAVHSFVSRKYTKAINNSFHNMKRSNSKFRLITSYVSSVKRDVNCPEKENIFIYNKINGSTLNFQLLDYDSSKYWCFNETEKLPMTEMNCRSRLYNDDVIAVIKSWTVIVIALFSSFALIMLVVFLGYKMRWHLRYYYISFKTTATMMAIAKRRRDDRNVNIVPTNSQFYDIFISYCNDDREWVLDELLPNIEMPDEMSLCLHERDFQVGLTILENIISCIDRSRCLMFVVSKRFMLSHWCRFEMHLAQHRMFETNKDHLILIFLEDIPKEMRPKNLQSLMDVKTYIKWPTGTSCSAEERKVFWKRLRRSVINIGWDNRSSFA